MWRELALSLKKCLESSLSLSFIWRPRRYNAEADELCNACLDKRDPNLSVFSPSASPPSPLIVEEVMLLLSSVRLSSIRLLPPEVSSQWKEFLFSLVGDDGHPLPLRRKLFCIAPHLLSLHTSKIGNRNDFKRLRTHIGMLSQKEYLYESLTLLKDKMKNTIDGVNKKKPFVPHGSEVEREEKRIKTLAARGLFNKIVQTNDIIVAETTPQVLQKTKDLFPQSPLPSPLPQNTTPHDLEMSSVLAAVLSLKRGKAPGLSGWTRELLTPLLSFEMTHPFFRFLLTFFNDVVNCNLEYSEELLLRTGALTLLAYKEFPEKIRPIVVKDVVLKIALVCLLRSRSFSFEPLPGSTYGKKGGSAIAVAVVQQQLSLGHFVLCCDAKNAFNMCSRFAAFKSLLSPALANMRDLFPLFNLIYAKENNVTLLVVKRSLSQQEPRKGMSRALFFLKCANSSVLNCFPFIA